LLAAVAKRTVITPALREGILFRCYIALDVLNMDGSPDPTMNRQLPVTPDLLRGAERPLWSVVLTFVEPKPDEPEPNR
jgi:hypothetical protein